MLRSASSAVKTAAQTRSASHARLLSSSAVRLRSDDSKATPPPRSTTSASLSHPTTSSSSVSTASTTKPVQISYNPPNKGTTGGGSITLNLPPQLVQAMSRKKTGAPTKTSSARAKAQASKALRQTLPEPTTGEVYAWATAHSYSFSELVMSGRLPPNYQIFEDNEVIHIPQWPVPSTPGSTSKVNDHAAAGSSLGRGEVFIFRSGSYVTWGLDEEQSQRFLRNVIQGRDLQYQVEVGRYPQIGDEAMDYLYASSQLTRAQGDIIVIGQPPKTFDAEAESSSEEATPVEETESCEGTPSTTTSQNPSPDATSSTPSSGAAPSTPYTSFGTEWTPTLARLAFSQGLARSARLSVQESALSRFLSTISTIPAQLETSGSVPLSRTSTIKHMGTLLRLRQTANLDRDNFYDEPEVYWENSKMEDHYRSICANLDIGQRFETLNGKLDHCENLLGVVRALLTEKTTHRMELIIIGLIAFEAGLALLGHGWVPTPGNVKGWWRDIKDYFAPAVEGLEKVEEGLETTLDPDLVQRTSDATPHLV
ncbi:hypothetical protein NDA11_001766 [Ustilago hordei]|uniref:DUF155 domain-containing protein n=1 Tax=Ustilago hordei TaxID=120017 RepID=I2FV57_USTHO|nr:uncharacterized protein UHO2_06512 [Ustilago hordei]KAJ1040629.1 hypothetical protein NDA10_002673 [Ustilago hordei]KAJ1576337.1 hypothetical protein NDA12_001958 [Ustilago hordei]KAJ1577778.1 hypothetical protein NDA15_002748 [Ustilago hordei]KAJ1596829.1 hypothetical protein NDA11_001766 [Ustilago hordei]KAJ1598787.1 hypothetical protein NDA14_001451 [Ustilago hordei]